MESKTLELAPLVARRELWLLISIGYVDPYNGPRFALLRDTSLRQRTTDAASLLKAEYSLQDLGPGETDLKGLCVQDLFTAVDEQWETREAAYRELFGHTAISLQCPPCEIEFEPNEDVAYRSQRMADISGFYRAFGLDVSSRAQERLDHISVETEFLYVLLAKEAAAIQSGIAEGAEVCRDARAKFFQDHVGWWLPAFSRKLSRTAASAFYLQLAAWTSALSAVERISLGLAPFRARVIPKPSSKAAPQDCVACPGEPGCRPDAERTAVWGRGEV